MVHPLITEAAKKAAIAWVDGRAAWCLWIDDALYVVGGAGEQDLSHLSDGRTVPVVLRGDHGGKIVTWPAVVSVVLPGTPTWDMAAPKLAAKRLNSPLDQTELVSRWAVDAYVFALRPAEAPLDAGNSPLWNAVAQPPRAS